MDKNELIERWFQDHHKSVSSFLAYFTGTADVEDLVQESFIKALKSLDRFQGNASPLTWLIAIARNTAIDEARKRRLKKWLPDTFLKNEPSREKLLEQSLVMQEEQKELYDEIKKLKQSYRDVVILRGIMEFSSAETSGILGWSENKVNVTLFRALRKLREGLENSGKGGGFL